MSVCRCPSPHLGGWDPKCPVHTDGPCRKPKKIDLLLDQVGELLKGLKDKGGL